jgi:hypothetical protein
MLTHQLLVRTDWARGHDGSATYYSQQLQRLDLYVHARYCTRLGYHDLKGRGRPKGAVDYDLTLSADQWVSCSCLAIFAGIHAHRSCKHVCTGPTRSRRRSILNVSVLDFNRCFMPQQPYHAYNLLAAVCIDCYAVATTLVSPVLVSFPCLGCCSHRLSMLVFNKCTVVGCDELSSAHPSKFATAAKCIS